MGREVRDQILARMYVVLTVLSIIPLFILAQVLWVAVVEGPTLRARGEGQAHSTQPIPAMRGTIVDHEGRLLAVNTARYDVALDPTVAGFTNVAGTFFEQLSRQTGRSKAEYKRRVDQRSSRQYVLLERGLNETQKEALDTLNVPGLLVTAKFARRYNYTTAAAHILGHVNTDGEGIAGVEQRYDGALRGTDGWRAVKRDRLGNIKAFAGGQVVQPEHGETVVLTLDLVRQTILEEELARGVAESGATWGTAIAMDPHTGAILAMANVPTYDPNRAGRFPTAARRNRAVTDRIEPGSTFKLVTAIAALDQGIIGLDDTLDTGNGYARFPGRDMRDTHGHGRIPFSEVIAQSSNIGTAKTALQMDEGHLYQYARNLGFGQKTGIDVPGEVAGLLKKPSTWSRTTQTAMSIGYEVDVTPLQVLAAYSALANGGLLVQPYLVAERRDVTGRTVWFARTDSIRRVFKAETARRLLPAFEAVVEGGTAKTAQVPGLRVAGKTGTAYKTAEGRYTRRSRASFVGFFPAEDPVVAMIVVMDEPETSIYGGVVSAPVFQRVATRWMSTFPDVQQRLANAEPLPTLATAGLPPPAANPVQLVALTDSTEAADQMPNLKGYSIREAVYVMAQRGIDVQIEGQGAVVSQSPAAGKPLPKRVVLRCR